MCIDFMLTCRQVYNEATSILYNLPGYELLVDLGSLSSIQFLGKSYPAREISTTSFPQLNRIRELNDTVFIDNCEQACRAQTLLFNFFAHVRAGHNLVRVNMDIQYTDETQYQMGYPITHKLKLRGMLGGRDSLLEPYSNSLLHAFLGGPFYTLPDALGSNNKHALSVNFTSNALNWSLPSLNELRARSPVCVSATDYKIFSAYFDILFKLYTALCYCESWSANPDVLDSYLDYEIRNGLASAGIRGDVRSLRQHHENLVDIINRHVEEMRHTSLRSLLRRGRWESGVRDVRAMIQELEKTLPIS